MVVIDPTIWRGCVTPCKQWGKTTCNLATNLSRCKQGMAHVFAVMIQILLSITSVTIQAVYKPSIYQGSGIKLSADTRIRVQESLQMCIKCGSKSKNCYKQLTHIVLVKQIILWDS
jgi:hypothetical protein